jgi:hypothetical protein
MKRSLIRITIAVCTFIIGVAATLLWLHKPSHRAVSDSTVYSVSFCDLARNSNFYDGKLVRTQTFFMQYVETSSLKDSECEAWMRLSCAADTETCEQIWNGILKVMNSSRTSRVKIDVVGRYIAYTEDPQNKDGAHVHLFEILELKGVEPAEESDR